MAESETSPFIIKNLLFILYIPTNLDFDVGKQILLNLFYLIKYSNQLI